MDFFKQTPEEISTLSLLFAINISNQYDLEKLVVVISFLSSISSTLSLIAVERGVFEKAATNSTSDSSSEVAELKRRLSELEAIISEPRPYT